MNNQDPNLVNVTIDIETNSNQKNESDIMNKAYSELDSDTESINETLVDITKDIEIKPQIHEKENNSIIESKLSSNKVEEKSTKVKSKELNVKQAKLDSASVVEEKIIENENTESITKKLNEKKINSDSVSNVVGKSTKSTENILNDECIEKSNESNKNSISLEEDTEAIPQESNKTNSEVDKGEINDEVKPQLQKKELSEVNKSGSIIINIIKDDEVILQVRKKKSSIMNTNSISIDVNESQDNLKVLSKSLDNTSKTDSITVDITEDSEILTKKSSILNESDSLLIDVSKDIEEKPLIKKENSNIIKQSESNSVDITKNSETNSLSKKSMDGSDSVSIDILKDSESKSQKQKKEGFLHSLYVIFYWIISIILLIIVCYTIFTIICNTIDKKDLEDYDSDNAKKIEVSDRLMSYNILGKDKNTTIVLLPGIGSPSPIIEYKPLAEALSDKYKIVTIEPFGYGFSDDVGKNRTLDNIVYELRTCTKKLGIDKYYLMGHSLGGLYSLEWAKNYPDEVEGFIGLDPSVPGQEKTDNSHEDKFLDEYKRVKFLLNIGLGRPYLLLYPNMVPIDTSYKYSDNELKIERILYSKRSFSKGIMEDINNYDNNLRKLSGIKFPDNIPVLEFLSKESTKYNKEWEKLHYQTIGNNTRNEVYVLDGSHYIHYKQKDNIVKRVKEWIK